MTNSSKVTSPTEALDDLNNQITSESEWNEWFVLDLNGGKINNLSHKTVGVIGKHFPVPLKEGESFLYWCTDSDCNEKYDPETTNVTSSTVLYAGWGTIIVMFKTTGGDASGVTKNVIYGRTYGELPTPTKTGYTFVGWYTAERGERRLEVTVLLLNLTTTLFMRGGWKNQQRSLKLYLGRRI